MQGRIAPLLCFCLLFAGAAVAQRGGAGASRVGVERLVVDPPDPGWIRVKDSAVVRIRIEGVRANPRTPKLPSVDGLELRVLPASTSTQMVDDGRRMTTSTSVQFGIELQPRRAGSFVIPPFAIWTGSKEQRTPELQLEVQEDLISTELSFLDVQLAPKRVYVHEPIRVQVSFAVLQGVRLAQEMHVNTRYLAIGIAADWLDQFPAGEAMELAKPSGSVRSVVCNDRLTQARFDGRFERDGKLWQRFTFERAFLPGKVGTFELAGPGLWFQAVRRMRRPSRVFRGSSAQVEKHELRGKPLQVEVLPIPREGRPSPYFGAVGRFELQASLDRDRLRVSESLKLTLTVRGQGNFEFLRMPELQELDGFHKLGTAEAQRDGDRVVVTYDLTPLSADVTEIPPIEWNYFDTTPGVEKFVEVVTPALPIAVDALVAGGGGLAPLPDDAAAAVTVGVDDIFDLPDLTGEPVANQQPATWLRYAAVVLPWLLCGLLFSGLRWRKRAASDVAGQRSRGAQRQFEAALRGGGDVLDALAGYLGDRLLVLPAAVISADLAARLQASGLDEVLCAEVAATVERGTAARYGGSDSVSADEARALVARLEGARFGSRSTALLSLLWLSLVIACVGASGDVLPAQGDAGQAGSVSAAVRAYRDQDYAAAEQAFARAYEASGDRKLLRARGNCLFRQGNYARARWAYESARLALPRDPELLANLKVVRSRLQLPEREVSFFGQLQQLVGLLTPREQLWLCAVGMLLAALCLVFGWRRLTLRWVGGIVLVHAAILACNLLVWFPNRAREAVALEELALTAEPRADLPAVATVREGVLVEIRGSAEGSFVLVDAGSRRGFVPTDAIAVVE